jgi:predicted ATPase/class 3 adenylate cyclase
VAAVIRTPDQRLRAFVSSTLQELAEERAAARDAILQLRLAPVLFELGARPHPARDLYRAYLDQSHIFIGIYWQKYGWVAPGEKISGLEDEYQLSGDKPKLIYLKAPAPDREPRLKDLLERIKSAASYKYFATAAELRDLIENDLMLLLSERFETPTDLALPTGTVTFLFTDIEGSADVAQQFPDALPTLLARHHATLHQAIEAHHGFVFQIIGDEFHVAFHTAGDALLAALDAQRLLHQQAWTPAPIKVRMGINTGAAQVGNPDDQSGRYTGYSTLARAQRVMAAAHGGQVLLSNAGAEQARGELPQGVTLRDMGEHRLKGLLNPEHLWQVVAPDLPQSFPRLQTLSTIPSNLPVALNRFVGRAHELQEVKDRLAQARLLTLLGPGGTGKTRLALQAAAELLEHFDDRVYFVDLVSSRDLESVLAAIARTIGLREKSDRPLLDDLEGQIGTQKMLLLLDNFEQVTVAAPAMAELLRDCPGLKQLVTSRETLHVRGENVFPVPPLALPQADLKHLSVEQLARSEAVQLFVERAQAVKPDFRLTNENAQAVAELCLRLDGLPLAIELATARLNLFSPHALVERLGNRLKLLRGGARDLPVRQQTLRGAIDWSYELLDQGEQRLFQLLSVFPGGCSFEAVETAARCIEHLAGTQVDILDGLASLAAKSLIRRADQDTGETRLMMLETIREYAAERLEADPEFSAAAHRAHATFFADFTPRQWERLTGHGREAALGEMESDIENVRAAWRYWVADGNLEQLRKLTDGLWLLYDARGWYQATVDLTADLLNVLASSLSTPERAQQEIMLQTSLARALLAIKGFTPEVEAAYTRALELCQGQGEIPQLFPVLRGLSSYYVYRGEFEKGARIGEQILSLAERQDDAPMRVEGHLVLGYNLAFLSDLDVGLDHLENGIAQYDSDQDRSGSFRLGNNPGVVCYNMSALFLWMLGFPDRALKRADDAVALATKLNHPWSMAYALFHTGLLHLWRREAELVRDRAQAVLDIADEHEFQVWRAVATCLHGAALAGMGRTEEGLTQVNKGIALYQGLKTPPIFWPLLLHIQAGVCGLAGKPEQGLALLDESLEIISNGSGRALLPEFFRLKGELLLALSLENATEAESWFQQALEVARMLRARMLELRAAISLSRLWRDQGKSEQGRRLVSQVYERLTEGFTTADMMEAKDLCSG